MKDVTCMIIEDEPLAREILEHYVEETERLNLVCSSRDGRDAWKHIQTFKPELIFLDVHLPEINGIELLQSLTLPPKVIFTTAYPDYAVKGFELDAVDYLVKPYSYERFQKAVEKVFKLLEDIQRPTHTSTLITIKSDKKWVRINCAEIVYIQSYGDYLKIITRDSKWVTKDTMKSIITQLPAREFLRIHKSYICNISKIQYMEGNQVKVGEEMLPVGSTYKEEVRKVFNSS